jgi:hypothetical protein
VAHDAAPLAPGPFIGFGRVGGAPDDGGERGFPIRDFQPKQAQSAASSVGFMAFRGPPSHEVIDSVQVGIDGVPVPAGLAVLPDAAQPFQVLVQCGPTQGGPRTSRAK